VLSPELVESSPVAAAAQQWILDHQPHGSPSVLLHGDLLPQNILVSCEWPEGSVGVLDWEFAKIGDPAYDLAIVTRGARNPLKVTHGLDRLLARYSEFSGSDVPVDAVRVYELLLHLN